MTNEENHVELEDPTLLYRADGKVEAAFFEHSLENAGIRAHCTGGEGYLSFGELGADALRVDVYVGKDDLEAGKRLIEELQAKHKDEESAAPVAWTCASCGEESEAGFDRCWKCGTVRG